MPGSPLWYTQIHFNTPRPIALVKAAADIPDRPGCYVFTENSGPLVPSQVLYVGKALSLRSRLAGYLVDYMKTKPTKHKGRAFIFEARHLKGDGHVFLRWTLYGDPSQLEASLIDLLEPVCNDRWESDPFADDEPLDKRYRL
jgi:excinuclease UvrABC nuclease subunit